MQSKRRFDPKNDRITLIPGDGVGPELAKSLRSVFEILAPEIVFEEENAGQTTFSEIGEYIPASLIKSLERNRIAIKGPITTPIGYGFRSINVHLRKTYDLYANIRPVMSLGTVPSKFKNVNIILFRENTEDLYAGIEEQIDAKTAHSIKVITYDKSYRIIHAAFAYASANNYEKVTVITKANIMKLTDGLFLNVAREVARLFPKVKLEEILIDNMCMQLVMNPERYGVLVTQNLYGDILSDLMAGLIGGLGLVPGANIGDDMAIFESVHGSALDIAGKDLVNPTAFLLSSAMMLDYINESKRASTLRLAINTVLSDSNNYTEDLNGTSTTSAFTKNIRTCLQELLV